MMRMRVWLRCGLLFAANAMAGGASAEDAIARRAERGPVSVELRITPAEPVIGDVVTLELGVRAEADVEILMPEFGEALGRFEIVDFAPSTRQDDDGSTLSSQKYRLQPARSGPQTIPPLRVEFVDRRDGQAPAPEGEDAYEILTDRIALVVEPVLASDAPLTLEPAHPDLGPRREQWLPWWGWLLVAAGALGVAAPFAWRVWLAAGARRRQRSAYEVARQALDALLAGGRPSDDTMDSFYVNLSLIVRRYLEDRFGLRSPELTTQEFLTEMGRSPDLARSHQQLLRDFLMQADLVKFAGHRPSAEGVAESTAAAERFLEDTRDLVRATGPASDALPGEGEGARA
ncbi:MAG: hypothetical protein CL908_14795 [Deltaproteobacteria bacterium]|nr:hypothetical protein [Deltaproteobacteria bacterium]